MKVRVCITPLAELADPQGDLLQRRLEAMGFSEVRQAVIGKVVLLDIDSGDDRTVEDRVTRMCKELLASTVSERFTIEVLDD